LQALTKDLGGAPNRIAIATLDVTHSRQVDAALALCKQQFGGIDYLVPCAGIFQDERKVEDPYRRHLASHDVDQSRWRLLYLPRGDPIE
jgi:NAD(P)-dependent dehydrogenase (short-subunit alcohol dehydrogenase family)